MNRLGEADDPSKKVGRDPLFRIGDQVADDHEDQVDDTSVASEQLLDDPDEESRGDGKSVDKPKTPQRKDPGMTLTKTDPPVEGTSLKFPGEVWRERRPHDSIIQLDGEVIRDEVRDVVMDISDSVDYVNTDIGHSMREAIQQQTQN